MTNCWDVYVSFLFRGSLEQLHCASFLVEQLKFQHVLCIGIETLMTMQCALLCTSCQLFFQWQLCLIYCSCSKSLLCDLASQFKNSI